MVWWWLIIRFSLPGQAMQSALPACTPGPARPLVIRQDQGREVQITLGKPVKIRYGLQK